MPVRRATLGLARALHASSGFAPGSQSPACVTLRSPEVLINLTCTVVYSWRNVVQCLFFSLSNFEPGRWIMQCPADTCVKVKVATFSIEPGLDFLNLYNGESNTVGARPGWLRALDMFRSISVLCGAFVWARRAFNSPFRRFSA